MDPGSGSGMTKNFMLIGAHISAAGGVVNAPKNASAIGCEVFQFFSRSPQGGKAPELTPDTVKEFKSNLKKYKQKECYIHAPYFINLASSNNRIYHGSISVLKEELERGSKLGVKYLMFHPGSAKDLGQTAAEKKVAQGISEILKDYKGSCQLLIEMSAGAGQIIGDTFEEIDNIIKNVGAGLDPPAKKRTGQDLSLQKSLQDKIGVCYDTAHAFASGYDIRTPAAVKKTFNDFNKILGIKKLKLIHVNDSKTELNSHRDRHEHIGQGKIGLAGFHALLAEPKLKNINLILETPFGDLRQKDIKTLKKLRK